MWLIFSVARTFIIKIPNFGPKNHEKNEPKSPKKRRKNEFLHPKIRYLDPPFSFYCIFMYKHFLEIKKIVKKNFKKSLKERFSFEKRYILKIFKTDIYSNNFCVYFADILKKICKNVNFLSKFPQMMGKKHKSLKKTDI